MIIHIPHPPRASTWYYSAVTGVWPLPGAPEGGKTGESQIDREIFHPSRVAYQGRNRYLQISQQDFQLLAAGYHAGNSKQFKFQQDTEEKIMQMPDEDHEDDEDEDTVLLLHFRHPPPPPPWSLLVSDLW
jgi:hypothetical protein